MTTPQSIIIGITGQAGAAKDTAADVLVEHFGFAKIAFADALREECAAAFGVGIGQFLDRAQKDAPRYQFALSNCTDADFVKVALTCAMAAQGTLPSAAAQSIALTAPRPPRKILQWWGTEYRRAQDPSYWLRKIHRSIRDLPPNTNIAIPDCRFDNEAAWIKSHEPSVIWEIMRDAAQSNDSHATAQRLRLLYIDTLLTNDSTVNSFKNRVYNACLDLGPTPTKKRTTGTYANDRETAIATAQAYQAQDAALATERQANAGYTYLASPYTAPASLDPQERETVQADRAAAAAEAAMHLAKTGVAVYSPIAHGHALEQSHAHYTEAGDATLTHAQWMAQCYPLLKAASRMVVLMLEGWEASKGVELEINYCHSHKIPVSYSTPGCTLVFAQPEQAQAHADQMFPTYTTRHGC